MIKARVTVSLKEDVMDPQGNAVAQALQGLGHGEVQGVRVGRSFELILATDNEKTARENLKKMCEELLANTVIERYEIAVEKIEKRQAAGASA